MTTVIAPCEKAAAKWAVERWHYTRKLPIGKLVTIGIWEDDDFVGTVIYSRGASPMLGARFGLDQYGSCELTRIAMRRNHRTPVSRAIAESLRLLKRTSPDLELVISFADPAQGHHGGVYQASNWIYTGTSVPVALAYHEGEWKHNKTMNQAIIEGRVPKTFWEDAKRDGRYRLQPGKHRYVMPLNKRTKRRVAKMAEPYPHAVEVSDGETPTFHVGEAGSIPADRSKSSSS